MRRTFDTETFFQLFAISYIDITFQLIIIALIILFFVSLTLFVRRLMINASVKRKQAANAEKKLDRMIELLEKDNQS
ncbi:DUF4083 family protein [Bacillaceae bacterium SIJ1]|uniref:DUF4083 family protein n=1 Tax=Litoribacterium kuwaitense TaxID=1398745 RepID=UPI0013EB386E|nr:DUF4083 family protein [Litoribacterium kuwaitense]